MFTLFGHQNHLNFFVLMSGTKLVCSQLSVVTCNLEVIGSLFEIAPYCNLPQFLRQNYVEIKFNTGNNSHTICQKFIFPIVMDIWACHCNCCTVYSLVVLNTTVLDIVSCLLCVLLLLVSRPVVRPSAFYCFTFII